MSNMPNIEVPSIPHNRLLEEISRIPREDIPVLLDLVATLSSTNKLVFTSGRYYTAGSARDYQTTEINFNPKDYKDLTKYDVIFNTATGAIRAEETPTAVNSLGQTLSNCRKNVIGQFLRNDCQIDFIVPPSQCIVYDRIFTSEFTAAYNHKPWINICKPPQPEVRRSLLDTQTPKVISAIFNQRIVASDTADLVSALEVKVNGGYVGITQTAVDQSGGDTLGIVIDPRYPVKLGDIVEWTYIPGTRGRIESIDGVEMKGGTFQVLVS